jgi:uncharacterized membrane protein
VGQVKALLKQYGVRYIYVGRLERSYHAGCGLDKFDTPSVLWREVYHNEQVEVFEVRDTAVSSS